MANELYQDEAPEDRPAEWAGTDTAARRDSSLMQSGLFNRFQQTLRLADARNPRTASRAFLFALVSWLPLVALAAVQGLAINDDPRRSLLLDFTVYARFLVAIPLFILGESVAGKRYSMIVDYFVRSGIVAGSERKAYDDLLSDTQRLRGSRLAELLFGILAYVSAALSVFYQAVSEQSTWLAAGVAGAGPLSWAGSWYAAVSLPLFLFLLYRYVWSWFVWFLFLWGLSRLKLRLTPAHPDVAGGLNILGDSPYAMAVFVFAIGAVLSARWAMQVVYDGASVASLNRVFIGYLLLALLISFGPLLVFTGKLNRLRLRGLRDYGALASQHAQLFDEKWIKKTGAAEDIVETPLGSPDISSLADLNISYEVVKKIKFFPVGVRALVALAAAALIPMLPLILMEFPLWEILKAIAGAIF